MTNPLALLHRALATSDLGPSSRQELEAVLAAIVAGACALVTALPTLGGGSYPIAGTESVGSAAALAAAISAAVSFVAASLHSTSDPLRGSRRRRAKVVRIVATIALTLVCMGFALIAVDALSRVFQAGFVGLEVEGFGASLIVAICSAGAAYLAHPLGDRVDTQTLGVLVPTFLAAGVLSAMLTADDPDWWRQHFSALGAEGGIAGATFNITLGISGLLVATMGEYVRHDLEQVTGAGTRVRWVGRLLGTIGVLMIGVGVVSVDLLAWLHIVLASGMVVTYLVLCAALPWAAPRLPRGVHVVSGLLAAGTVLALLLWVPLGYYNFTGFELAACGLIFVWLTAFLRAVAAATADGRRQHSADADAGADAAAAAGADAGAGAGADAGAVDPADGGRDGDGTTDVDARADATRRNAGSDRSAASG